MEERKDVTKAADFDALKPIQKEFMESYVSHKKEMPLDDWLPIELRVYLPEKSEEDIKSVSSEILSRLRLHEEKKASLDQAAERGQSTESWFAGEMRDIASKMAPEERDAFWNCMETAATGQKPQGQTGERNNLKDMATAEALTDRIREFAREGISSGEGETAAQELWKGTEIAGTEEIRAELDSGNDIGVKAAAAGALKVGSERGLISVIPQEAPAVASADAAFIGVERAKIGREAASGKIPLLKAIEKWERRIVSVTTGAMSSVAGGVWGMLWGASAGSAMATSLGAGVEAWLSASWLGPMLAGLLGGATEFLATAVLGPLGAVLIGTVGVATAYMAGSTVGDKAISGFQKLRHKAAEMLSPALSKAGNAVKTVGKAAVKITKGAFKAIAGRFGRENA